MGRATLVARGRERVNNIDIDLRVGSTFLERVSLAKNLGTHIFFKNMFIDNHIKQLHLQK